MRKMLGLSALALLLAAPSGAATIDFIAATDAVSGFDVSSGLYASTAAPGDGIPATVTQPSGSGVFNADLNFSIMLDGAEGPATVGTRFIGGNATGADLWIVDPVSSAVLLTLEIDEIFVTNIVPGGAGSNFTSVNLGGIDVNVSSGQSSVTITGGSLAGDFGGVGTPGLMFMLVNAPSKMFLPGLVYNTSFTAQTNVQLKFVPEPGTGLLVGVPLLGLAAWRRRRSA